MIEKKILHRMSLISMNHTRAIADLSGPKLIFWLFKNVQDVSYYSMDIYTKAKISGSNAYVVVEN